MSAAEVAPGGDGVSLTRTQIETITRQVQRQLREQPARERKYALGHGWTPETVCAARLTEVPDLERIVVAVSPALPDQETGIIVAGRDADGDCYVLADRSLSGPPRTCLWAALLAHDEYRADAIAGMVNLVGDYMEALLKRERYFQGKDGEPDLVFKAIHAHRDFPDRCKPVGALYEQGRVHHVGAFPELEDRMFTWMPWDRKPMGRLEALVCAITELESR